MNDTFLSLSLFPSLFFRSMKGKEKKKTRDARLIAVNTGSSYFLFSLSFSIFNFFLSFGLWIFPPLFLRSALHFVFPTNRHPLPSSFIRFSGFRVLIFVVCIRGKNEGEILGRAGWPRGMHGTLEELKG